MAFGIEFNNDDGLTLYANLFSATDFSKAWRPSISDFATFSLASQSAFALVMTEDSQRIGWYTYTISDTTNIPAVTGDEYYFIEVRQQLGGSPNRANDPILGNVQSFFGRAFVGITAQEIWEYTTRTLTEEIPIGITPQQIWEYASRTLTESECACDIEAIQTAILAAIEALSQQLTATDQHIEASEGDVITVVEKSESDIIKEIERLLTPKPNPKPIIATPVVKFNNRGPDSSITPG